MLEWQNEAEAYKLLCQETHTNMMKDALEMERQSLTSEREAFQRECAQMTGKINVLQLEKKHKKVFEKEMAMTREAIIKEKSDIQNMRVAFHGKRKRRIQQYLREQRMKRKAFQAENDAMADDRRSFQIEKEDIAMMRKAYIQDKTGIQRTRDAMQLEKENIANERKAFKKGLEEKCV